MIALLSLALAGPITAAQAREDVLELAALLEASHPDPFLAGGGRVAFYRRVDAILRGIPEDGLGAYELYERVRPLVASIEDGHTQVYAPDHRERAPGMWVDFEPVGDALFVDGVYRKADRELLGLELASVGGVPVAELAERMSRIQGQDNAMHGLVHLADGLQDGGTLGDLLERPVDGAVQVGFIGRDPVDVPLSVAPPGKVLHPDSKLRLPELAASDIGWGFLDREKTTAYVRIASMMRYREAFEVWRATGFEGNLGTHLDAVVTASGIKRLPPERDARIALVPSATDAFTQLFTAMKAAGTRSLVVDLRDNEGGNSAISYILGYYLAPLKELAVVDDGYQVRRFSPLYATAHANSTRPEGVPAGAYDFAAERAWQAHDTDAEAVAKQMVRQIGQLMPTFAAEAEKRTWNATYVPEEVTVLTSARTYSAGFDLARMLHHLGARMVGVPSAQAGNCYIDVLPFELTHSHVTGGISSKWSVAFPDDPVRGELLMPDVVLTAESVRANGYDPDASVELATRPR